MRVFIHFYKMEKDPETGGHAPKEYAVKENVSQTTDEELLIVKKLKELFSDVKKYRITRHNHFEGKSCTEEVIEDAREKF